MPGAAALSQFVEHLRKLTTGDESTRPERVQGSCDATEVVAACEVEDRPSRCGHR